MFDIHLTQVLLSGAVAVHLLLTSQACHAAVGNSVLLVIMDDIGVDLTMFYPVGSYRRVTTPPAAPMPNLTALAQHGVVFGNAWAQMECSPTRAEIITGQYGFRPENRVGQWIDEDRIRCQPLHSPCLRHSSPPAHQSSWRISVNGI